jgi:Ser/Thr protein kinase RdoA (MazF antagonist)
VHLAPALTAEARLAVQRAIDRVERSWDHRGYWETGIAHGDFAPINVIRLDDSSLALVDLDDLRLGPRLLDVAWWGWVVRYHHPAAWQRMWTLFVESAGLEPGPQLDSTALAISRIEALRRAVQATDDAAREMWHQRLHETAGW